MRRVWALMVVAGVCAAGGVLAQAPGAGQSQGGYDVTRSSNTQAASSGWVGLTTTSTEQGVGNTPATEGSSYDFEMVQGGKARQCPSAEGIVDGDFVYRMSRNRRIVEDGVPRLDRHAQSITARLEGHVGQDARLQYVDVDATLASDVEGVTSSQRMRTRFVPTRGFDGAVDAIRGSSLEGSASFRPGQTADLFFALVGLAGPIYLQAEGYWVTNNNCVEFDLTPATKSRALQPNESVTVEVRLKLKQGQAPVPGSIVDANALQNQGRATITRREITAEAAGAVTYTAPPARPAGKGFSVAAASRAGVAQADWVSEGHNEYELQFESTITSRDPIRAAQSRATGTVRLTGSEKPSRYPNSPPTLYLRDGTGTLSYQTSSLRQDPCDPLISGGGTTQINVVDMLISITDNYASDGSPAGTTAQIVMPYSIGMTNETEDTPFYDNFRCVSGRTIFPSPFFWEAYLSGRGADGEVNFLRDWEVVNGTPGAGGVVATKTLRGNCGGLCDEELSVWKLIQRDPADGQ